MPFLQFVLLSHLRFTVERLVGDSALSQPEVLVVAIDSVDLLSYGQAHHPKPYWRDVMRDLDVVFEMLEVADRRDDWDSFLKSRTSGSVEDETVD